MVHRKKARLRTGKRPSRAVRTDTTREDFITFIRSGASFQMASELVGKARSSMYAWYRDDADFRAEVEEAREGANDRVEDEIWRRGVKGVRIARWHEGKVVGYERVYSDRMLELRARRLPAYAMLNNSKVTVDGSVDVKGLIVHMTEEQLFDEMRKRGLPVTVIQE